MRLKNKKSKSSQLTNKVNWLNILHFYQPPFQEMGIVRKVTEECYLPVTKLLLKNPIAKAVININGCLLELLDKFSEGKEVIENLKSLFLVEQIEITGTGKHHPIFPLINTKELKIQLLRQEMSLQSFLGVQQTPKILFLPELAYLPEQTHIFEDQGYSLIIIDEISVKKRKNLIGRHQLKEKRNNMNFLARERDMSESLGNFPWRKYDIRTSEDFVKHSLNRINGDGFIVTASDVEVFGHHQRERWKLLAEIYDHPSINSISINTIPEQYETVEVETVPASWSTSSEDISRRIYYPLWHHPQNRLHRLLWQLLDLTTDEVRSKGSESQNKTMELLFSSCPFFWASCMPWWNGIIVEKAADSMFNLLSEVEGIKGKMLGVALSIKNKIYDEVSMLNETGKAKKLQDEFLRGHKLNRSDTYHLLH